MTEVSTPESVFEEMFAEVDLEASVRWELERWVRISSDPRFMEKLLERKPWLEKA